MGASCRITFEIDDGTFITPGPSGVTVTNNEYLNYLSKINTQQLLTGASVILVLSLASIASALAAIAAGATTPIGAVAIVALILFNQD